MYTYILYNNIVSHVDLKCTLTWHTIVHDCISIKGIFISHVQAKFHIQLRAGNLNLFYCRPAVHFVCTFCAVCTGLLCRLRFAMYIACM